jgi:hypothetical protein
LGKGHHLAASLSHVETRQVRPDYTLRWDGKLYQIERAAIVPGLRQADVRVEARLDGTLAVRHRERYLPVKECTVADVSAGKKVSHFGRSASSEMSQSVAGRQ